MRDLDRLALRMPGAEKQVRDGRPPIGVGKSPDLAG
jgi:hypothetical protein